MLTPAAQIETHIEVEFEGVAGLLESSNQVYHDTEFVLNSPTHGPSIEEFALIREKVCPKADETGLAVWSQTTRNIEKIT